ncbi:OmpA family protein [Endozoicomonas arenosclerae]|uniref:OmpA family protein n=1 Tax=Endozoicomonas arenosclerae TaxID=1633495 RepID=UPI0007824BE9|nr:flagellar motor protein MotB [Endozoicomonas arenosclerae]
MSENKTIVIKRVLHGHGGHHGGGWKVALADFALAMMALFLVLWLLNVADDDQKAAIAAYFADPGAFRHKSSLSPIDFGGKQTIMNIEGEGLAMKGREGPEIISDGNATTQNKNPDFKPFMDELQSLIIGLKKEKEFYDYIHLEMLPEGLRIVILDSDKGNMFRSGSSAITAFYEDLLLAIAPIIAKAKRPLMVSGHTDSVAYARDDYSNWELSSSRAQVARRTLIHGGVPDQQVLFVVGMADRVPRIMDDPESGANRRIEILLLNEVTEHRMIDMFAPVDERHDKDHPVGSSAVKEAKSKAEANQLPEVYQPE